MPNLDVRISDDGEVIAFSKTDQLCMTFRGKTSLIQDDVLITSLALSGDGRTIAYVPDGEHPIIRHTCLGDSLHFARTDTAVRDVAITHNGDTVVVGYANNKVMVTDVHGVSTKVVFSNAQAPIRRVDINQPGTYVVAFTEDSTAYFWDMRQKDAVYAATGPYTALALAPEEPKFVVGTYNGWLCKQAVGVAETGWKHSDNMPIYDISWRGNYIISASTTVALWTDTTLVCEFHDRSHTVDMTPDARHVVTTTAHITINPF